MEHLRYTMSQLRLPAPVLSLFSSQPTSDIPTMPAIIIPNNRVPVEIYPGPEKLRERIYRQSELLGDKKTFQQVLKFSGVTRQDFDFLCHPSTQPCKCMRLGYDHKKTLLIVKVMPPGGIHESIDRIFGRMFIDPQLTSMGVTHLNWQTGCVVHHFGDWSKQADNCWSSSADAHRTNIVLEIGLSETDNQLEKDAQGWIESQDSSVQIAITISYKTFCTGEQIERQLNLRIWERRLRVTRVITRAQHMTATQPIYTATQTAHIKVWEHDGYLSASGDDIHLPLELFIDRPPQNAEHNILITKEMVTDLLRTVLENFLHLSLAQGTAPANGTAHAY